MDGMTRTNTLNQCRVRHYHECGQTRENVTFEGVLFTRYSAASRHEVLLDEDEFRFFFTSS